MYGGQRGQPRWPRRQPPATRGPPDAGVVSQGFASYNSRRNFQPRQQQQQQKVQSIYGNYPTRPPPASQDAQLYRFLDRGDGEGSSNPQPANGPVPYKTYVCPGCKLFYDFCDRNNCYVGRVPLILECAHTVCQDCIYKRAAKSHVECPVCQAESSVPKACQNELQQVFTPNYHIVGLVLWHKPRGTRYAPDIKLVPAGKVRPPPDVTDSIEDEMETEKCCMQRCDNKASIRCVDCEEILCAACFSMLHNSVKSMRHHETKPIAKADRLLLPQCDVHPSMMEILCKTCDKRMCIYCYLDEHEGHEKIYLNRLNPEEKEELKVLRVGAKKILRQFVATQKQIENLLEFDPTTVERDACSTLSTLHAQLCLAERRLRLEAAAVATPRPDGAEEAERRGLAAAAASAAAGLARVRRLLSTDALATSVDAKELLAALREARDIPRFLVNVSGSPAADPVRFVADVDLAGELREKLRVERGREAEYALVGGEELPDGYEAAEADLADEEPPPSPPPPLERSDSTFDDASTTTTNASKGGADGRRYVPHKTKKKRHDLENETVRATYIRSMDSVYLQIRKFNGRLQKLCRDIESYVVLDVAKEAVAEPEPGETYLALFETQSQREWCRARILEVSGGGGAGGPRCDVQFVDYGHEQTLGVERLRPLPAALSLARLPPMAYECRVAAPTGSGWAKKAHLELSRLVHDKDLIVRLVSAGGGIDAAVPTVDLLVVSGGGGSPTSVADLLVYVHEGLATQQERRREDRVGFEPLLRIFGNSTKLAKGKSYKVIVANAVDPHNIFVHLASYADAFERMRQQMKRHYRQQRRSERAGEPPQPGSYVVVDGGGGGASAARGRWQRALVADVDAERRRVHALLVDWGGQVAVPVEGVRPLREPFAKMEAQAVAVRLAHVEPPQGWHAWPDAAVDCLRAFERSGEQLRMMVVEAATSKHHPQVALFDIASAAVDVCLNARLAANGLAKPTGPTADHVEWARGAAESAAAAASGPNGGGGGDEPPAAGGSFVDEMLKRIHREARDDGQQGEDEDDEDEAKQQVEVVRVVDPGQILIKFQKHQELSAVLFKEMQIHYNESAAQVRRQRWQVGDWGAARCPRGYRRAKVVAVDGDTHRVYLPDDGDEADVTADDLFVLERYFQTFRQVVYCCHLARVRPAGDTGRWSASATDALSKLITGHPDVHLVAVGPKEELEGGPGGVKYRSLPVRMWYQATAVDDELGYVAKHFVSVEGVLVKLGYAYRVRVEAAAATPKKREEKREEEAAAPSWVELVDMEKSLENAVEEEKPGEGEAEAAPASPESPYKTREVALSDWLPPFRLESRDFAAVVTCAETGGGLFLHDGQLHEVYENLERRVFSYFEARKGAAAPKKEWEAGGMCTVRWEGGWYRARVLGHGIDNPRKVRIFMVDFGSDHEVEAGDLREEILFPDVPPFATKTKLDEVVAVSGSWLPSDYDKLLRLLGDAGQHLRVHVRGPLNVDVPAVRVTLPGGGGDLAQALIALCPNLTRRPLLGPPPPDEDDGAAVVEDEEPWLSMPEGEEIGEDIVKEEKEDEE